MLALTGTWGLLRAVGINAARLLAAAEPRALNRRAQHNAASAAAAARAQLLEVEDADHWLAACLADGPGGSNDPGALGALGALGTLGALGVERVAR